MKSFIAVLAAAATVLLSSSCASPASDGHTDQHGSESSAASTANGQQPAAFNDADVAFVTDMIPHHEQAVDMSALVPDRSTDPAVIKLAADISAEQGPEIETMKGFLVQWKGGAPGTGGQEQGDSGIGSEPEGHSGMDGMQMPGMVDDGTMSRLQSLKGAEFDALWLQSMIGHHEGAIGMANTEIAGGANADAKKLAQEIATTQQGEIGQMKKMLGG